MASLAIEKPNTVDTVEPVETSYKVDNDIPGVMVDSCNNNEISFYFSCETGRNKKKLINKKMFHYCHIFTMAI